MKFVQTIGQAIMDTSYILVKVQTLFIYQFRLHSPIFAARELIMAFVAHCPFVIHIHTWMMIIIIMRIIKIIMLLGFGQDAQTGKEKVLNRQAKTNYREIRELS